MKLGLFGFALLATLIGCVVISMSSVPSRYAEGLAATSADHERKISELEERVINIDNEPYPSRKRYAYETYNLAKELAEAGYVSKASVDAALDAVNYGSLDRRTVGSDFANIHKTLDAHSRMANDMAEFLKAINKF